MPICPNCKMGISENNLRVCRICKTVTCQFCNPIGLCPNGHGRMNKKE